MGAQVTVVRPRKSIAIVAHDHKKTDLLEWAKYNRELLANHDLLACPSRKPIVPLELAAWFSATGWRYRDTV
jgi:methylglyoxal synthase